MHQAWYILTGLLLVLMVSRNPDWGILVSAVAFPLTQFLPPTGIPGLNVTNLLLLSLGAGLLARRSRQTKSTPPPLAMIVPLLLFSLVALCGWINSAFFQDVPVVLGRPFTRYASFLELNSIWTLVILTLFTFYSGHSAAEVKRQLLLVACGMSVEVIFSIREGLLSEAERITGHVGQVNRLAALMALAGATYMALFLTIKTASRWVWLVMSCGAAFACLRTGSRGGLLSLFLSLLVICLFRNRLLFLLLILLGLGYRLWLPESILIRLNQAVEVDDSGKVEIADTARQRMDIWRAAGKMMTDHPLGVGLGTFSHFSAQYGTASTIHEPNKSAHNAFIGIAAELSPIGLVVFLWLLGALAKAAYGCYARGEVQTLVPVGFVGISALLSMTLANMSSESFFYGPVAGNFWIIMGLASRGNSLLRQAALVARNEQGQGFRPPELRNQHGLRGKPSA